MTCLGFFIETRTKTEKKEKCKFFEIYTQSNISRGSWHNQGLNSINMFFECRFHTMQLICINTHYAILCKLTAINKESA